MPHGRHIDPPVRLLQMRWLNSAGRRQSGCSQEDGCRCIATYLSLGADRTDRSFVSPLADAAAAAVLNFYILQLVWFKVRCNLDAVWWQLSFRAPVHVLHRHLRLGLPSAFLRKSTWGAFCVYCQLHWHFCVLPSSQMSIHLIVTSQSLFFCQSYLSYLYIYAWNDASSVHGVAFVILPS